jgi:hypothetical protein
MSVKVQAAEGHITAALKERNVRAKLIVSGSGDWRYLDVVPMMAGKLQSLEYVRQEMGIPKVRHNNNNKNKNNDKHACAGTTE